LKSERNFAAEILPAPNSSFLYAISSVFPLSFRFPSPPPSGGTLFRAIAECVLSLSLFPCGFVRGNEGQ